MPISSRLERSLVSKLTDRSVYARKVFVDGPGEALVNDIDLMPKGGDRIGTARDLSGGSADIDMRTRPPDRGPAR